MLHRLCLPGTVVKLPTLVGSVGVFQRAVERRKFFEAILSFLFDFTVDPLDVLRDFACSPQCRENENDDDRHHPNFYPVSANWHRWVRRVILHVVQDLFFSLVDNHRIRKGFAFRHLKKIKNIQINSIFLISRKSLSRNVLLFLCRNCSLIFFPSSKLLLIFG